MRFVPYQELGGRPSIVVDGYGADGTVLTLSHWPGAGTPEDLTDDLSTQIAFRYLDRPDLAVDAEAVSNNHFDEDGLCGIYAVLNPEDALRRREALIDVASAGDFGTFRSRSSARIATALMAYADSARSPLEPATFAGSYPEQTAVLYAETLALLPEMLDAPERFRDLWAGEDAQLERDLARIGDGTITIEERPGIDLAIVRVPEDPHPMAINNATERMRILVATGRRFSVRYRYETWVRYVSRPLALRIDLAPLAERLSSEDGAAWSFDGNDDLTPALHRVEGGDRSLDADRFIDMVDAFLRERK